MSQIFILRFDADEKTGAGHFVRCHALGQNARQAGLSVLMAYRRISPSILDKLNNESTTACLQIEENLDWGQETDYLFEKLGTSEPVIILDVSTPYAFDDIGGFGSYLASLKSRWPVALIDGLQENAITKKIAIRPDMVIMPYVGADQSLGKEFPDCRWLLGPRYFIFQPNYASMPIPTKRVKNRVGRILVSFGGVDPCGTTLKAMSAIGALKAPELTVRVAVGSGFSSALKGKISQLVKASDCRIMELDAPGSLFEHMLWCDLAVTGTGLTKYELALTGTPSIQISINKEHAEINQPFAATGVALHIGIDDEVVSEDLQKALIQVMSDYRQRAKMSRIGRKMVDINGVRRVTDALLALKTKISSTPKHKVNFG
jgi:spore coat polysaccharide biosynthesis predicted glycosyltransferase SpsG